MKPSPRGIKLPPGTPTWITAELVADTLKVWQPYYAESLTVEDALGMIMGVGQLINVFSKESSDEAVRRSGPCQ